LCHLQYGLPSSHGWPSTSHPLLFWNLFCFEVNSYVTASLAFGCDLHHVFSFVWTVILFDVNTVNVAELFNLRGMFTHAVVNKYVMEEVTETLILKAFNLLMPIHSLLFSCEESWVLQMRTPGLELLLCPTSRVHSLSGLLRCHSSFFFPWAIQFTYELYCLEVSDAWFNLQDLATVVPTLEKAGVDLLSVSGFYSYAQYSTLSLCEEVYATES
jgi:hypothetical protein